VARLLPRRRARGSARAARAPRDGRPDEGGVPVTADSRWDELVILLSTGLGQRRLYHAAHPKVAACGERFARRLNELLAETGGESFFLGVVDGKLVHDGRYLVGSSIVGRKLIEFAERLHCGGFLFPAGTDAQELQALFTLGAELREPVAGLPEARALLAARGVRRVGLSPVYEDQGWFGQFLYKGEESWGGGELAAGGLESMLPVYQSLFGAVEGAHHSAARDGELDIDATRALSEKLLRSADEGFLDIMQLVRYPDYDSYTVGHSVRVAMIAVLVGHRLGLAQPFLVELGAAGLLHDVGKAKVPEEILYKPTRLSPDERRVIERHPALGAHILLENRAAGPLAVAAAWGHHLRHDGRGYPSRPPWAALGRATALLHVCDAFEALTAVRPYKLAMTPRRAYEIMLSDRGAFDPSLLAAFMRAMGLYPPGSQVRLTSGEQALVLAAGPDIARPRVRVVRDTSGAAVAPDVAPVYALGDDDGPPLGVAGLLVDDATSPPDAPDRENGDLYLADLALEPDPQPA